MTTTTTDLSIPLSICDWIKDDTIRAGVDAAIRLNLLPAAVEQAYPGHFNIVVDGSAYGGEATWPGLDSWQMAGAYLRLGKRRMVLDYYDFVTSSQRADGNIPFAIFPAEPLPDRSTYLRSLRDPQDVFEYEAAWRDDRPSHTDRRRRKWIGLFEHWQPRVNPLRLLGSVSYILTAHDIFADGPDTDWLARKMPSLEKAGGYLLSRRSDNGLISGAGFYVECPPRHEFDGVAQCYTIRAWRMLAELCDLLGLSDRHAFWTARADELTAKFLELFWREDHFIESIHPGRGPVDSHGLSDVNWAAIGLNVATDAQARKTMDRMIDEPRLWRGGMPSQLVADPFSYEEWELNEPLSFAHANGPLHDVAAMGRVWHLEALACARTGHHKRLRDSMRLVCKMGEKHNWRWHERYLPQRDGNVQLAGPGGYCEYPAILVRVAMGHALRGEI